MKLPEKWEIIEGYGDMYAISNYGELYNLKTHKSIKPTPNNSGLLTVKLYRNKKPKSYLIHRLVAEYFIEGFADGIAVRHRNRVLTDNCVLNLELGKGARGRR